MTNTNQPKNEWYFEDENDKELGIETQSYDNGNLVKRATLSDGRIAIVRELKGKDMKLVDKVSDGKKDEYLSALMHVATKIHDGDKETGITLEELDELKGKDHTKLKIMATTLNF